jgi:hypothetical protein
MKCYTSVPKTLKPHFFSELENYQNELDVENLENAGNHLERAHIIGQKDPYSHTLVHWKMLKFGIKIKNTKESIGQIPRLVLVE